MDKIQGWLRLKNKEGYVYQFRPRVFLNRLCNMLHYEYDLCTPSYGLGIFDAIIETHANNINYWRPSTTRRFYQFIADNVELIKYRLLFLCKINSAYRNVDFNIECERIQKFCILQRNKLLKYEILHENKLIVDKEEGVKEMINPLEQLKTQLHKLIEEIVNQFKQIYFFNTQ